MRGKRFLTCLGVATAVLLGLLVLARRKLAPSTEPAATLGLPAATATAFALLRTTASSRVRLSIELDADTEDMAAAEARRVITRSRAAYAACTPYEDEGTVDTAFRGENQFLEQVVFRTVFAGPNAVRMAYQELPGEFGRGRLTQVIVNDAGAESVGPWNEAPQRLETLEGAMNGLAGVSHGLTRAILPLLPTGSHDGHTWLDVPSPVFTGIEEVDGETCDVLEAMARGGTERVRISIGRNDSLIHRISEDTFLSGDAVRSMIAGADDVMREAGLDLEMDSDRDAGELSTFEITTFHPRCGRPIAIEALRLTDGSL